MVSSSSATGYFRYLRLLSQDCSLNSLFFLFLLCTVPLLHNVSRRSLSVFHYCDIGRNHSTFESNISWVGWANLHHHLPLCYLELWHGGTIEVHSGRICSIGAHRWMITPIIIIMAPLDNNTNNLISPIFIGPRFDLWVRYSRSLRRPSRSPRTVIRSTMCTAIRGPWVQSPEPKFETLPASQRHNGLRIWLHDNVSSKIFWWILLR